MAYNSGIEWTHHTASLWWGCMEVHAGCDNCYAREWAARFQGDGDPAIWGALAARKPIKSVWGNFMGMQAKAAAAGEVHRVFVGSMMDIFETEHVTTDGRLTTTLRQRFFEEVVPSCPNLLFLLLTKRPGNINKIIPAAWLAAPPKNVMFGASIVDPKTAHDVAKRLNQVNGALFYSVEPQLEFIDFQEGELLARVQWLIQGGESGPNRRPFDINWAYHTQAVCAERGVAYFFKQIDKVQQPPADLLAAKAFPIL